MHNEKKRLFIAVDIADTIREDLRNEIYKKGDIGRLSWVRPENFHITLKFLGDVDTASIDTVSKLMDKAAAGRSSFKLKYANMGVFPNLSRPRVLWVGFEDSSGTLKNIVADLEESLSAGLGTAKEKRPFSPHLTVARIKGDVKHVKLSEFIKKGVGFREDSFEVSEIVLYESELKQSGAVYSIINSSPLKPDV